MRLQLCVQYARDVCVCVCVCMHVHVHKRVHAHVHVCVYMHTIKCVCVCAADVVGHECSTCLSASVPIATDTCVCVPVCVCVCPSPLSQTPVWIQSLVNARGEQSRLEHRRRHLFGFTSQYLGEERIVE
jgi:hypothetical protein